MAAIPPPYTQRDDSQSHSLEFAESTSVRLEWRVTGLRAMYDATKGEAKSKCIKSAVFGDADNHWEVLFYANSGVQGGEYSSLYISCVPTDYEREESINGKWTRKGLWWFRFEIKPFASDVNPNNKNLVLASKDASDHQFAVKTANWGWQQFIKRDALFLQPAAVEGDGFRIICTVQAQPQPPAGHWLGMGVPPASSYVTPNTTVGNRNVGSGGGLSAWAGNAGASSGVAGGVSAGGGPKQVVPKSLVSSVGDLLDDPLYSDVAFVFPKTSVASAEPKRKTIYANKTLLRRCEYFEALLEGDFAEKEGGDMYDPVDEDDVDVLSDSDVEDELNEDGDGHPKVDPQQQSQSSVHGGGGGAELTTTTSRGSITASIKQGVSTARSRPASKEVDLEAAAGALALGSETGGEGGAGAAVGSHHAAGASSVDQPPDEVGVGAEVKRPPFSAPSSASKRHDEDGQVPGPKKSKVIIRDAAYTTWLAILFWIYTDTIYFTPLSSSFPGSIGSSSSAAAALGHSRTASTSSSRSPLTRREWIQAWMEERGYYPGETDGPVPVPVPVSAKSVYRLADKLDLPALKIRAFQHILSQLTPANCPAEVFSRFSSTFEEIGKVQVAFFLKHWAEIKKSDSMTQIWQQIRVGKHVGFEEVWPLIVSQLEFKQS